MNQESMQKRINELETQIAIIMAIGTRALHNANLVALERVDGTVRLYKNRFGENDMEFPSLVEFDAYVKEHDTHSYPGTVQVFHEVTMNAVKVEFD